MSDNQLRLFMERIDRLEEEKKGISDDIRDVYSEAKGQGYDAKIMRALRKLMKMSADDRSTYEAVLDTYKRAVGLDGTPLGDFAKARVSQVVDERLKGISKMSINGGPEVDFDPEALKAHIGKKLGVH